MTLKTLQGVLVATALAWALAPYFLLPYGAGFFLATFLLLAMTLVSKGKAARQRLKPHLEEMGKALPPEAVSWAQRYPFFYVWPEAARQWGVTLKMTALVMLLLSIWFGIRGAVFLQPTVWLMIVPAAAVFAVGVVWGGRLDLDDMIEEDRWKPMRPLHDEVKKVLTLQSLAGKWSPGEPV